MTTPDLLKQGGLRAYEIGRIRKAARASWLIVPIVVACAVTSGATDVCLCLGAVLLTAAVFLRWRNQHGMDSVRDGLLAGSLPLLVGLIATQSAPDECTSACAALCLAVSLPAGIWIGRRTAHRRAASSVWFLPVALAALVASLGCAGLGLVATLAAALGLALGHSAMLARSWTRYRG